MRMTVSHAQCLQQPNFVLKPALLMTKVSVDEFLDGYPGS